MNVEHIKQRLAGIVLVLISIIMIRMAIELDLHDAKLLAVFITFGVFGIWMLFEKMDK